MVDEAQERRSSIDALLVDMPLVATIGLHAGAQDVALPARVIRLTPRSALVEFDSGVTALAAVTATECTIVLHGDGIDVRLAARPGRRVEDVQTSRRVEIVFSEVTGIR